MMKDEMVGWHHGLNGREFEQAPEVGDGQGSLECCSPRGCKESGMTEQLNDDSILRARKEPFMNLRKGLLWWSSD